MKQLIDLLFERVLKVSIFVYFSTHFLVYFDVSCNALTCIQDSKKNENKNENESSMKMKKTKLRQVAFEFIANLDKTSLRDSFAKFYDFATKSLRDFELSTRLSNDNVISFHFTFVRASLTHIFLEDEEREDAYERRGRVCDEDEEDRASQIFCNVASSRERECFEQLRRLVYE